MYFTTNFSDSSIGKVFKFTHVLAASFAGLVAAAAASSYRRAPSTVVGEQKKVIPELRRTESGRLGEMEKFSHYVGMYVLGVFI